MPLQLSSFVAFYGSSSAACFTANLPYGPVAVSVGRLHFPMTKKSTSYGPDLDAGTKRGDEGHGVGPGVPTDLYVVEMLIELWFGTWRAVGIWRGALRRRR